MIKCKLFLITFIEPVEETDDWYSDKQRLTIKEASPFTKEYLDIENNTNIQMDSSKPKNILLNLKYLEFLQTNFMPYIFIWGGFIFKFKR